MSEEHVDLVNSPDVLKKDPDSLEFYILRDEKVAVCKDRRDLPYWQNRSTYLSAGRLSPKFKKVVFWSGPINPGRAMELLKENMHIDEGFTYAVADSAVRAPKVKKENSLDKLQGVRVMIEKGMKVQKRESEGSVGQED
jgi:hypothetical protein